MKNDTLDKISAPKSEQRRLDPSPMVTVVIPSYNHAHYVVESIKSVTSQTYKNVELIVIDDGSRDESPDIIRSLAEQFGFQFRLRENRGLAKTLNEAIDLASGKYICFLASDDFYLPCRIENAVSKLEAQNDDVAAVYCDGFIVNNEGCRTQLFGEKYIRPWAGSTYNNLIGGNWIPALGVTYRTERLREFMFDERYKVEDYTLYLKIFKTSRNRLVFYNDRAFAYRWHGANFSASEERLSSEFALMLDEFDDLKAFTLFKQLIRTNPMGAIKQCSARNISILFFLALRKAQVKLLGFLGSTLRSPAIYRQKR